MPKVKLNAMRILEQTKIPYTLLEFPDTIHSADGVAEYFGVEPEQVYKTLVVLNGKNKPLLVLVSGSRSLHLKTLAKSIGEKKVTMAAHKEAETLTGLLTGGISPLALRHKNFPVYFDRPVQELENVIISAGKRGVDLEIPVKPLLSLLKAKVIEASQA